MNTKEKTAITELIEHLDSLVKSMNYGTHSLGINASINAAKRLIDKEREQIEEAYWEGNSDGQVA